jgi:Holliday junction DNA helicase RuvA
VITFLHGKLCEALPTQVTVEVHGVGYEVLVPLSSFDRLPAVGSEIHLLTHLAVREDAHTLYGFLTSGERDLFRLLIHTVSGIGPKLALNVLSGTSVSGFCAAVAAGDVKALSSISGVGRKTAERMVMELRDKLPGIAPTTGGSAPKIALPAADAKLNDAVLALTALGFKASDAHDAVRGALVLLGDGASVEQLVRACLKRPA